MLTITRDVGYWLLLASAALGLIVFFASINDAFGDRRSGLNPWIAALGALATVVAVLGPMIPEGTAIFSDNWYLREGPGEPSALLLLGRLVQLALLADQRHRRLPVRPAMGFVGGDRRRAADRVAGGEHPVRPHRHARSARRSPIRARTRSSCTA